MTKDELQQLKEKDLRQKILMPLLQAMGYSDVFEHHGGTGEQGKDIVCWKPDELGVRENLAIVVKAQDINGQAGTSKGSAGEVYTQVSQCFGKAYLDNVSATEQHINQCWVVTNRRISKEARESISSSISATRLDRLTRLVDGEKLWKLVEQYLPALEVWQVLEDASKALREVENQHFRVTATIAKETIEIGIEEKYPGAALAVPITISTQFTFPKTPEGLAKEQELKDALETGSAVTIPGEFIKSIEWPEWLRPLVGAFSLEDGRLQLSPVPQERVAQFDIHLDCNNGSSHILYAVPFSLIRAGRSEITLESGEYPVPVIITLSLREADGQATISIRYKELPLNVLQLQRAQQFRIGLSQLKTIRCVHSVSGLTLFSMQPPPDVFQPPDPAHKELIDDLAAIQERLKRPIVFPNRDITPEEWSAIALLRTVLHDGRLKVGWHGFSIQTAADHIPTVLETFGEGKQGRIMIESEDTVEVFGTTLSMGVARLVCEHVVLANEVDVRGQYFGNTETGAPITVEFAPGEGTEAVKEYLDWAHGMG